MELLSRERGSATLWMLGPYGTYANDLEAVVFPQYPQLAAIKADLLPVWGLTRPA